MSVRFCTAVNKEKTPNRALTGLFTCKIYHDKILLYKSLPITDWKIEDISLDAIFNTSDYSEEDIERIWGIKLLIGIGFSAKEIREFGSNPDFSFYEIMTDKVEQLEKRRGEILTHLGFAAMNERNYGKDGCLFIANTLAYFGGYDIEEK